MHVQYQELDFKARRIVFKIFLDRVVAIMSSSFLIPLTTTLKSSLFASKPASFVAFFNTKLDHLAKRDALNGQQIKNTIRCTQALVVNERKSLTMYYLVKVLEAAKAFEQDLNGGTRYLDAMRSYTWREKGGLQYWHESMGRGNGLWTMSSVSDRISRKNGSLKHRDASLYLAEFVQDNLLESLPIMTKR